MQEWYLMTSNTRPNLTGGFENDIFLDYKDDAFSEALETDIAETVILYSHDLSFIKNIRCIIQNNTPDSSSKSGERQCLFQINSVKTGMYIFHEDKYWLITGYPGNNGIYEKVTVSMCNWPLKWQSEAATILSYHCIDEKNSNTLGLDVANILTRQNTIHKITLPLNESTVLLRVGKRFFLDRHPTSPSPYIVTDVDNTSKEGLVFLTVQKDELNHDTDNVELGICDYISPAVPENPPDDKSYSTIICDNYENKIIIGYKAGVTLTPIFYDSNGSINENIVAVWKFNLPTGLEKYIHINYIENKVSIYTDEEFDLYDTTITAYVSDGNEGYQGEIVLTLGGW